jgi:signal transduction histidine kinase
MGVGLALCRRLVEAVGGALWLDESPSPTGGAAFLLRLPVPTETD